MSATNKNPYEPSKVPLTSPDRPAAPPSKSNAFMLAGAGAVFVVVGAHFDDPRGVGATLSPVLRLIATAAHLGGGIALLIGLYRIYRANRSM
jgi:hypothetical protein